MPTRVRWLHAFGAAAIVSVGVAAILLAVGWALAHRTPGWWTPPHAGADAERSAESLEQFVSNELSRPRDDTAPWRFAVPEDAATAWVNSRLPRWLENREIDWPFEGIPVLVRFRSGTVVVGLDVSTNSNPRIVGAELAPTTLGESLNIGLGSISVGTLKMPPSMAASIARSLGPTGSEQSVNEVVEAVISGEPIVQSTTWPIDGGRSITVLDIAIEDGRVVVTCSTGPTRQD